jgi:hypothetical protein
MQAPTLFLSKARPTGQTIPFGMNAETLLR